MYKMMLIYQLTALFSILMPVNAALQRYVTLDSLKVSNVWSGHPVDFAFIYRDGNQYIGYYDTLRRMTIAVRSVNSRSIRYTNLPSTIGWDSHNYIAIALDSPGYIHVSGNMHSSPLVYFRSGSPFNIENITKANMTGDKESSVTYPVFFNGPDGKLIYMYRDGSSGNGNQIFNKWNSETKLWSRLFDKPLFDGQGNVSAYMGGPTLGPDGYYHVYWSWRESPDAGTTFDVNYIRSKDLVNWETATGNKITLPITVSTPGIILDKIPQRSGLINRGAIGFDSQKRVIITYHKYDFNGYTQLYNARLENGKWIINQTSNWNYKWEIGGTGTLILQVTFGPVIIQPNGALTQSFYHVKNGIGLWELDESTLKPKGDVISSLWPKTLESPKTNDMVVHWTVCSGDISEPSVLYALRWETLPENQDKPRSTIPAPTQLMIYKFKDVNGTSSVNQISISNSNIPSRTQKLKLHLFNSSREINATDLTYTANGRSLKGIRKKQQSIVYLHKK